MDSINYKKLYDDINASPGMIYYKLIMSYDVSRGIFVGNYQQLRQILLHIHDPQKSFDLFNVDNRDRLRLAQIEVVRLFHNFTAAALTLVEHCRLMMRDDAVKVEHRGTYQDKVNATFANDPLSSFVQGLRNYILHCGIPFSGMTLKWTQESQQIDSRVVLDIGKMKDWDGWRGKGKEYVTNAPDSLVMLDLVEEYGSKVEEFQKWFAVWFVSIHKSELDALQMLQTKWNEGIMTP